MLLHVSLDHVMAMQIVKSIQHMLSDSQHHNCPAKIYVVPNHRAWPVPGDSYT